MKKITLTPDQAAEAQELWHSDGEEGGTMFGQLFTSEHLCEFRFAVLTASESETINALLTKFKAGRRCIRTEDFDTRVFETFAELHPHEAYELDPDKMVAYAQKRNPALSVDDIKRLLAETEGGGE